MISIGSNSILEVSAHVPAGILLTDGEKEILLPNKFVPKGAKTGDKIDVFVYTDSEDRPIATTQTPLAKVGDFACLKVIDESQHGAFLDWGLDKDLFVPKTEQHSRMIVGRSYVVAVFLDNATHRVAAASRLGEFLDYDISGVHEGSQVQLMVYGFTDRGAQVLVNDRYGGLIFHSETFQRLTIGDKMEGFVGPLRQDNKLDIRLQRSGAGGSFDAQTIILEALKKRDGLLHLGDKSPPDKIYAELGISKKAFKSAVGALYKRKLVSPSSLETRLNDTDDTN